MQSRDALEYEFRFADVSLFTQDMRDKRGLTDQEWEKACALVYAGVEALTIPEGMIRTITTVYGGWHVVIDYPDGVRPRSAFR